MPVINGKVVRSRWSGFKMAELSSVDSPAQPGALATILKRADPAEVRKGGASLLAMAVAKYVDSEDGAHTFDEVLQANLFEEKIWPMTSALSQAIRSIMGDTTIKQADREAKVTQSVDEFLAAVRDLSPTAEKKLAELISKGTDTMNWQERAEKAEAELVTTKASLASTTADLETAKAALTTEQGAHTTTKAALAEATDEVLKVGEKEVRKSKVGEDSFVMFKAQEDRAQTAELEKRATTEFPSVVGTATEKALVLKAAAVMDEPTRKAFDAIMTSAEKMAAASFKRFGHGGGNDGPTEESVEKAVATYKGKVAEIVKRDSITEAQAMSKARTEFPAEFAAAYPDRAEA
jgi:hypothetical protein